MSYTEPPSEADRGKETRRAHELGDRRKQNLTCVCRAKGRRWLRGRELVSRRGGQPGDWGQREEV